MTIPRAWIADDLPDADYDPSGAERGDCYATGAGPGTYSEVTRPIGFMRRKPRVRVKAWTMPIIFKDD